MKIGIKGSVLMCYVNDAHQNYRRRIAFNYLRRKLRDAGPFLVGIYGSMNCEQEIKFHILTLMAWQKQYHNENGYC